MNELRDPERRPPRLSEAIPAEVSRYWPHHQFELDQEKCTSNLHSAPRGSAARLAGDTNERFKVLLDDEDATSLTEAAEHLSKADLPTEIADALAIGTPGKMLFAYLDDICVLCDPGRVAEIVRQVQHALHRQTGTQVNLGKANVWNGAAVKPTDMHTIGIEAWKGEGLEKGRGLVVLGVPIGHTTFLQKWLANKEESRLQLLARVPAVQDATPLDMCWTQGEPHPPQLAPFRSVRIRPEPRQPLAGLPDGHHGHASAR